MMVDDGPSELDSAILLTERALIGSILIDRAQTIPSLSAGEFLSDRHAQIWETICDLADGTDLPQLATHLAACNSLEAVGGPAYLAQCVEDGWLVIPALVPRYAAQVREASRRRLLKALGREMAHQGLDEAQIARRLASLPGPLAPLSPWTPWATWRDYRAGLIQIPPLRTGLAALDAAFGGFQPGEVAVIGGRTSHGKSAFATHLALTFATTGVPVCFVSLEETAAGVTARMLASRSGVPYSRLVTQGALSDAEHTAVEHALAWLEGLPLHVVTVETLRSLDMEIVCGAVAISTTPVVIVDHLQKIQTHGDSRAYGIEAVMNQLHATALREHRSLILCAQLNRESEYDKRAPRLSDLRDSGAVEILARKVLLLYWPFKHDGTRDRHEYQIQIAKQSAGGTGVVRLRFQAETGTFWDDPTPGHQP